jgi:hypothetical protein
MALQPPAKSALYSLLLHKQVTEKDYTCCRVKTEYILKTAWKHIIIVTAGTYLERIADGPQRRVKMGSVHIYAVNILIASMLAISTLCGCVESAARQQPPVQPPVQTVAIYKFDPILISPLPVMAGQPANISLRVENTGNAAGIFMAELTINGTLLESRAVSVEPGNWSEVEFQATLPTAGHYEIKIAPQTAVIDIAERKETLRLGPDTGVVDGCDVLAGTTGDAGNMIQMVEGNMIKFAAPPGGYEINKIDVFGNIKSSTYDFDSNPLYGPGTWVYGGDIAAIEPVNPYFTINIWDSRRNKLFSQDYNKDIFSYIPQWVSVDVPGIKVNGDFYIELVTHNQPKLSGSGFGEWDYWRMYIVHTWYYQLCIGYVHSLDVVSSVSQNGSAVTDRYLTYNWLVRTNGYLLQN